MFSIPLFLHSLYTRTNLKINGVTRGSFRERDEAVEHEAYLATLSVNGKS